MVRDAAVPETMPQTADTPSRHDALARDLPAELDLPRQARRALPIVVLLGVVFLVPLTVVLCWLPLLVGTVAFVSLRRAVDHPGRPDLCRETTADALRTT